MGDFGPNYVDGTYGFNPLGPYVTNKNPMDDTTGEGAAKAKRVQDAKKRIAKTGQVKNSEEDFAAADDLAREKAKQVQAVRRRRK